MSFRKLLIVTVVIGIGAIVSFVAFEKLRFHKNLISNKIHFKLNQNAFVELGNSLQAYPHIQGFSFCSYKDCISYPNSDGSSESLAWQAANEEIAPLIQALGYPGPVFLNRLKNGDFIIPNLEVYGRSKYYVYAEWRLSLIHI